MSENKNTFCSFIDMQKAFDWVNRDMLFYRLLDFNIDETYTIALKPYIGTH